MDKAKQEKVKKEKSKPKESVAIFPETSAQKPAKKKLKEVTAKAEKHDSEEQDASQEFSTYSMEALLKRHTFTQIEGLQFKQDGEPIYYVSFRSAKDQSQKKRKLNAEEIRKVGEILKQDISLQFLRQCLIEMSKKETQDEQEKVEGKQKK